MGRWPRYVISVLAVVGLAVGCANRPTDGHPLQHFLGQWPSVVVEDHTSAYFPVDGSFGPAWGIQGAIRGNCADYPTRICYKFFEGSVAGTGSNAAYTRWAYYDSGPYSGQKFWCTTTISPDMRTASLAIRTQIVRHEIGHCYGMAHAPQGTGVMEPIERGDFPNPTQDERDTVRSLYVVT